MLVLLKMVQKIASYRLDSLENRGLWREWAVIASYHIGSLETDFWQ